MSISSWSLTTTSCQTNCSSVSPAKRQASVSKANMTGETAGFDFGLKTFLTVSDGTQIESPEFFKSSIDEVREASKSHSTKQKGSNNREKARLNLARKHQKIVHQRHDFHFKLASQLTQNYDVLCFEDLNLEGMKRLWGRKISDLGFCSSVSPAKRQASVSEASRFPQNR